jgi:hypothetical protein
MDVLKFVQADGDYTIIIRTDSIYYAWSRFASRVGEEGSLSYCKYTSSDKGSLQLCNPNNSGNPLVAVSEGNSSVWENQMAVFYETNNYMISVIFPKVDGEPKVLHANKKVEDFFFFDKDSGESSKGGKLNGEVSFLNEPGVFKLEFEYTINTVRHREIFTFEIVSPKLDTKRDYKKILKDVNDEYDDIIFRYLSTTYQQFHEKGNVDNDEVWIQVFESVVESYLAGINRIIHKPHFKTMAVSEFKRADKIKRWSVAMSEEYWECKNRGADELERHYFNSKELTTTINTLENRFVKYTLNIIGERLIAVVNKILSQNNCENISSSRRIQLEAYKSKIYKLKKDHFFKTIGRFEGLKQESLVLQSKIGYVQIYKDWIKLKRGIDLYNGSTNIGTLQIWEIYELWCFIKMKHLICEVMGLDPRDGEHVMEDKNTFLEPFQSSNIEHTITFKYTEESNRGDEYVTLHYQRTFNRFKGDVHTATTEQRPDIVLDVHKSDGFVLTYLYDAKYRLLDDNFTEGDSDVNADYPVQDAINQMHRYRDAIYYGFDYQKHVSKEVIGGYILFPGRGDDKAVANKYFYKSIEQVNIGAFPLLPNAENDSKEGSLLKQHLKDILITKDKVAQIINAKPQRGLYYTTMPQDNDVILIGCVKSEEQLSWVYENELYNIRLLVNNYERPGAQVSDINLMLVKHIILYKLYKEMDKPEYIGCYDMKTENLAPMFFDYNDMKKVGYPFSDDTSFFNRYLVYEIETNADSVLQIEPTKINLTLEEMISNQNEEDKGAPVVKKKNEFNLYADKY